MVAHQCRDVGLFDPEDLSRFHLGEVTLSNKAINLERQFCFQELPLRMRQAEIAKLFFAIIVEINIPM